MDLTKLKAWDIRGKRMLIPTLINVSGKTLSAVVERTEYGVWNSAYRFDQVEFIQFTGKQDGYQNDLYTGDIVTSTEYLFQRDGKYNYHGVVEWSEEDAAFTIRKVLVDGSRRGISDGIVGYLAEYDLETFEKLGNVYEHPHLLERS